MVLPIANPTKSYWIEAAESPLRDFRSTVDLPKETDVVIVGSGYTGATTAYWLHRFTENNDSLPRMLMLEARDICGGATGRNGGQLRPHAYSRYPKWSSLFGPDGALEIIKHEMAHLSAFQELLAYESIAEEVCFELGETFDAAMSDKAWARLKNAYTTMQRDHGEDGDVIRDCRLIEDSEAAEEFTQMKSCIGAVVHPAGQVWPYKFVHALLRIVSQKGNLNLQANTPAVEVSERDADGWITVKTPRGDVRTKVVVHATNRWASHLLPDFGNLIFGSRGSLASIKAPQGFIKNTGAQHWDHIVNNYHLQLPPPYNTIILGGGKSLLVHDPRTYILNDSEDKQFDGLPEFYQSWPASDVAQWPGEDPAELGKQLDEGGVWSGVMSSSIDEFPFVGAVPLHDGHFLAAGFTGHGMPRILLSTAYIVPLILTSLGVESRSPALVAPYPPLPKPFHITTERIERLQKIDAKEKYEADVKSNLESAKEPFCNDRRSRPKAL
ncbi:FAD dependent oxidoreductase-domain-containing protein [Bisporella sp. PMI_857]|nr:FAD dependent oxidoreductase-domain-containing protein [Bisporella sp. PMI_857]